MITFLPDYPFIDQITASQARSVSRVATSQGTLNDGSQITVSRVANYAPVLFSRVAQYKEMVNEFSPEACKLFMHIAVTLGYEDQKVHIRRKDIGMSEKIFSRGMIELMSHMVIAAVPHKRELYWVNLAVICVGKVPRIKKDV